MDMLYNLSCFYALTNNLKKHILVLRKWRNIIAVKNVLLVHIHIWAIHTGCIVSICTLFFKCVYSTYANMHLTDIFNICEALCCFKTQ